MWWEWRQVENIEAILAEVRATWNIDENRVLAYGCSDGGAALFFHAMWQPDRFAGYAGSVAPPDRLVRADFRPDGQLHVSNLSRQRFHLDYGATDRKVPKRHAERYLELFEQNGAHIDWVMHAGQGHSLALPQERLRELASFFEHTRRDPLPDRLSWATERTDRYARRSWLVIESLTPPTADHEVDESNLLPRWGTSIQLRGPTSEREPWGSVELELDGNTIRATTRRVERFALLLSPNEFDLDRPVLVVLDGQQVFNEVLTPSPEVLLRWAARDDDRTLLFAAELGVEVLADGGARVVTR